MKPNIKIFLLLLSAAILLLMISACNQEVEINEIQAGETPEGMIMLYTSDGGENWNGNIIWPFPNAIGYDISSRGTGQLKIAGQMGFESGLTGLVLNSSDGGQTWYREAGNLQMNVLNSVFSSFYSTVAGENSTVAITTNNGANWSYATLNSSDMNIRSVAFNFEGTIGIAAGDCMLGKNDTSFIYRSSDLGQTWSKVSTKLYYLDLMTFNDVVFTDYTNAVAVSDWGSFMRTSNGGLTWFIGQAAELRMPLKRISLANNSNFGLTVGDNGNAVKTINRGVTWFAVQTGVQSNLLDVFCINENTAFAVGEKVILKSTDGGNSWIEKPIPYDFKNSTFRSVYFYDQNHGYIIGGD